MTTNTFTKSAVMPLIVYFRRDKQKTTQSQGSDEDHVSGSHKAAYVDSAGVNTSNAGDSDPKHWMTDWDYRLSYILTTQQC